ncbi:MAG: hypothetical protein OXQ94_00265 [Gemmatimonadota bacterium]|nr:hypothetical protein [Gemmatimonadota bacterium]MDE2870114.1 hypothetical protein [Gemmatimonadota bacterium]
MRRILVFAALLLPVGISACKNPVAWEDYTWRFVSLTDAAHVTAHMEGRVFWEFDGSRDAEHRKGIELDFYDGLSLRALYYRNGDLVDDWKVFHDYYWIEKAHGLPIYRFDFRNPTVQRTLPRECEDCIDTSGLIILVRDYGKKDEIQFSLVDSAGHLPSPFPVFRSWTRFVEDDSGVPLLPPPPGALGGTRGSTEHSGAPPPDPD